MPLIFLLDTSAAAASFRAAMNNGFNRFIHLIDADRGIKDMIDIEIIEFNEGYSAAIGEALLLLQSRSLVNAYKPWVILVSCGEPSDDVFDVSIALKKAQATEQLRFIALGAGQYKPAVLKQLTDIVFRLDGTDFFPFFDWVMQCIHAIAQTSPGDKPQLPPLQGNVYRDK